MELARAELRLFGLQECFAYRLQGAWGHLGNSASYGTGADRRILAYDEP